MIQFKKYVNYCSIHMKMDLLFQGTVIMPFQEECHNDPKFWERPDEFYPEHFIDENGKLITKKDGFLPFSIGMFFENIKV